MARPPISLKSRALRFLSQREHSRLEMQRKLARYAQEGDDVDAVLAWLEASGFLSQQRFSESLVHRRSARFGNLRIMAELQSHALEPDATAGLKERLTLDEIPRAVQVLQRKFPVPPSSFEESSKQMHFLQLRGFSSGAIRAAMREAKQQASDEKDPDFNAPLDDQ